MNSLWALIAGYLRAFVQPISDAAAKGPAGIQGLVVAALGSVDAQAQQQDIDAINALATIITDFEADMDSMSSSDVDFTKFLKSCSRPGDWVPDVLQRFSGSVSCAANAHARVS